MTTEEKGCCACLTVQYSPIPHGELVRESWRCTSCGARFKRRGVREQSLFLVQDGDRPMYVLANDWTHAVLRWREVIQAENPEDDCSDEQPDGVHLLSGAVDLLA